MNKTQEALIRSALEKAQECNESNGYHNSWDMDLIVDAVLKEALAQPAQEPVACHCGNPTFNTQSITHTKKKCFEQTAQEPVAWTDEYKNFLEWDKELLCDKAVCKDHEAIPLYTHPAPSWQGLDIDDRNKIFNKFGVYAVPANFELFRAIEQALKEKNT